MAGFREFVTGEVLTAANVDDFLMKQSVQKYADAAARDAALGTAVAGGNALREGMVAWLDDTNSVIAYDGTAWATVGETVVKSVHITKKTATQTFTGTNADYEDVTDLSVTITPKTANSKFLLMAQVNMANNSAGLRTNNAIRILRDATNISPASSTSLQFTASDSNRIVVPISEAVVDAPMSTSEIVYKVQASQQASASTQSVFIDRREINGTRVGSSSFIVVEFE